MHIVKENQIGWLFVAVCSVVFGGKWTKIKVVNNEAILLWRETEISSFSRGRKEVTQAAPVWREMR